MVEIFTPLSGIRKKAGLWKLRPMLISIICAMFVAQVNLLEIFLVELSRKHIDIYMSLCIPRYANCKLCLLMTINILNCLVMTHWGTVTLYCYVKNPTSIKDFLSFRKMAQLTFPQFVPVKALNIWARHSSYSACQIAIIKHFHRLHRSRKRA